MVSFIDSITITIFSMIVVFVGLIILAMLISILKKIGNRPVIDQKSKVEIQSKLVSNEALEDNNTENNRNDEELVAVIAAAIASSLGVSIPQVNIKSIRRLDQTSPSWAVAGRQEQIQGRL